ncbi:MAG: type II toxin-antitoxin system Phd/YefM family antitoxin, partial [Caldilineaceae bacterium]|nr:type II toxin-antitoxin system Phd/YefM family antitoxin [Caldilineaceae bacterium]
MAELHIGAEQFRRQLTDLLNRTSYGQDHVIIERHGTALAALIPYELYEALVAAGIPEKLAQLDWDNSEATDLAAALDAILERPEIAYPTADRQPATTAAAISESVAA